MSRISGLSINRSITRLRSAGSSGANSAPHTPSISSSSSAPRRLTMTGTPADMASRATIPKLSRPTEGTISASNEPNTSAFLSSAKRTFEFDNTLGRHRSARRVACIGVGVWISPDDETGCAGS